MTARLFRRQLLLAIALAVGCDTPADPADAVKSEPIVEPEVVPTAVTPEATGPVPTTVIPEATDPVPTTVIPEATEPKPVEPKPVGPKTVEPKPVDLHPEPCEPGDKCWQVEPKPHPRRGRPFGDLLAEVQGDRGDEQASRWVGHALAEHASVAAFARHTLELMAVGAPIDLVMDATRAQADEVQHAERCLEVARHFGAQVELGPLDTSLPPAEGLFEILRGVAAEGCVAEALSVWDMIAELERTHDPLVRDVLEVLITDEIRHAQLAWRTLAWGLPKLTPEQRATIRAVLAERPAHVAPAEFEAVVGHAAAALAA